MNTKYYYGFRFYSGRNCTTGDANPRTGRMSKAGEAVAFLSLSALQNWIDREDLSKPCGCGGGKRIVFPKTALRKLYLGETIAEFEDIIENLKFDAENQQ